MGLLGSLFSSSKSSSSNSSTTNNDNRQVFDASGGGDLVTGQKDLSENFTVSGTGNSVSFLLGDAQALATAAIKDKNTTGHEVTKAGQAQAAGLMPSLASESGKWGIVAVVALLALAWRAAK